MPGAEQTQAAGGGEQAHSPAACNGTSFQAFSVGSRAPRPHAPLPLCLLRACLDAGAGGLCRLPQTAWQPMIWATFAPGTAHTNMLYF